MQNPTEPRPLDQLDLRRRFDTKIAILLRDDLESWQRLNAAAFLASGIAASDLELIGEPYADADGTAYHALFRQPVMVSRGRRRT